MPLQLKDAYVDRQREREEILRARRHGSLHPQASSIVGATHH